MTYRIEKYEHTISNWILLFSTSNYDYASHMFKDCVTNNKDTLFRLSIDIAKNFEE